MRIRRGMIVLLSSVEEPGNTHCVIPIAPTNRYGEFLCSVTDTFMATLPIIRWGIDYDCVDVFDDNGEPVCVLGVELSYRCVSAPL